jgi:hypothetical protein
MKYKVERGLGICSSCTQYGNVIFSYSEEIYKGGICPNCILYKSHIVIGRRIDDPAMVPIVFMAHAILGHEPYATLLRSAEKKEFDELEKVSKEFEREKMLHENRSILKREGLFSILYKPNRKDRRTQRAKSKKNRLARKRLKRIKHAT